MEREGDISLDHLFLSNTSILCALDACNPFSLSFNCGKLQVEEIFVSFSVKFPTDLKILLVDSCSFT